MARRYTHSEIVSLVAEYKRLEEMTKAAKQAADQAIAAYVERCPTVNEWNSAAGTVERVACKGRESLDKAKVAAKLPPAEYAQCISQGEPYFQLKFKPNISAVVRLAKTG